MPIKASSLDFKMSKLILNIAFHPYYKPSASNSYHDEIVPDPFQLPLGVSLGLVLHALCENSDEERAAVETAVHVFILAQLQFKLTFRWECRSGRIIEMRRSNW